MTGDLLYPNPLYPTINSAQHSYPTPFYRTPYGQYAQHQPYLPPPPGLGFSPPPPGQTRVSNYLRAYEGKSMGRKKSTVRKDAQHRVDGKKYCPQHNART